MAFNINDIAKLLFKKLLGVSSTDTNRQFFEEPYPGKLAVMSQDIWSQSDLIPPTASPLLVLNNDIQGVVQLKKNLDLVAVPGTTGAFYSANLADAIPFNFGDGSYNYKLKNSLGQVIPFGLGDWIVDTSSGVVTFYGTVPPNMPPNITFYKYIGTKGVESSGSTSSIVNVNATGTNSYIGTSVEGISSYDLNTIYIITFQNANTAPSIVNIDSVGILDIVKGDETGLVPLEAGDIQPLVAYYMLYDGGQMQLFTTDPSSTPNTYTNLNPVPATLGGVIVGTTFNNTPVKGVFDMLLYPYISSQFGSFGISGQAGILEVGQPITSGSKTFLWTTSNPGGVAVNSVKIKQLTAPASTLASSLANDGNEAIIFSTPIIKTIATSHSWRVEAKRTNNSTMYRDYSVVWRWRIFHGTSPNVSLTESEIESLSASGLAISFGGTYNFAGGDYKYFAFPTAFAAVNLFKDATTQLAVAMAGPTDGFTDTTGNGLYFQTVSVTNGYGITLNYRVYRTRNPLGGSINITLS